MTETPAAKRAFEPSEMPDVPFGIAQPEHAMAMTGLDILRSIPAGEFPAPPMARTMQHWIHAVDNGRVEFRGNPSAEYLNPLGLIHGGWSMTLLDSAMGSAVQSTLPKAQRYVSLGTEVKFLRPITVKTGQVRAVATVIDRTRQTVIAEARIEDQSGRILATGTSTCFLISPTPTSPNEATS